MRMGVFLFLVFLGEEGVSQNWRWQSRLDISWVRDSNVFESLTETLADHTGRLLIELSGRGQTLRPLTVWLRYKGGLEGYGQYSIENRMVNDGMATCEIPIQHSISSGVTVQCKAKTFFQTSRGYLLPQVSSFLRWSLPHGLRGTLVYSFSFLDYTQGTYFDTKHQSISLILTVAPIPEVTFDLQGTTGKLKYERHAFEYVWADTAYQWFDLGRRQKDHFHEISAQIEIYKWALCRIRCSYQKNVSNSYGYSHSCPELRMIIAKSLPWDLTLRFFWTLQWKQYVDSFQPLLQIRPDSENEESSFTIIDISKDFFKNSSLRFRLGWYRNESPFRDRYYEKNLLSLGFTQRF